MARTARWGAHELNTLKEMKAAGRTYREIAEALPGRTREAVRSQVRRLEDDGNGSKPASDGQEDGLLARLPEHVRPVFATLRAGCLPSLDALFEVCLQMQDIIEAVDPVTIHEEIKIPGDKPAAIMFPSCSHLGGRYTFYERFRELFCEVLEIPRLYWASLGDDVEGFLPSFRDAEAVLDQLIPPKVQRAMLAQVLDILAADKKLLLGCASQHGGDWNQRAVGDNPIKEMYLARKVPFFDGKAMVSLKVGKQDYVIALGHAFPGSSIYNPTHAQRRAGLWDFPSADVIVQGDKHNYAYHKIAAHGFEHAAGLRESPFQHLIQAGTAKSGPDKYTIKGWFNGVFEWPVVTFWPDKHKIKVSNDLEDVRHWLGLNGKK